MKKRTDKNAVKKPNALLYFCVAPFFRVYYRLHYHQTITKKNMEDIKPPYLVVAGHAGWLDFAITSAAMFPHRMNYVGAYNFFRDPVLKHVMTGMGVIPKHQFTNDIAAIKKIKYCINQGRIVALFPHGCLSNEGRPGGYAVFGVAKLIKHLGVPVVAVKTDGSYLTRPRWTKTARAGRMETTVFPVLMAEETQTLSAEAVYSRVMDAIDFDDYAWQRKHPVPFKGRNLAEGVEYVLYRCPKCGEEFTLKSEGNRLTCEVCGNTVRMNQYLMFEPENESTVYFDGIDKWYDFQTECLKEELEDENFRMTAQTELRFAEPEKYGYQHQGFGEIALTREAITYTGTVKGEQKEIILPMKLIPMIPYAAGEYIEVANDAEVHRFILADLRQAMKWVIAVGLIREKYSS